MSSARLAGQSGKKPHRRDRRRRAVPPARGVAMPDHKIGTREEWQTARNELAKLEAEYAELGQKVTANRRELPWVPVETDYRFDTEDGEKTLAELFAGRSQLLAYNIMFGPDYSRGACPGCSNLGDELSAALRGAQFVAEV